MNRYMYDDAKPLIAVNIFGIINFCFGNILTVLKIHLI